MNSPVIHAPTPRHLVGTGGATTPEAGGSLKELESYQTIGLNPCGQCTDNPQDDHSSPVEESRGLSKTKNGIEDREDGEEHGKKEESRESHSPEDGEVPQDSDLYDSRQIIRIVGTLLNERQLFQFGEMIACHRGT